MEFYLIYLSFLATVGVILKSYQLFKERKRRKKKEILYAY